METILSINNLNKSFGSKQIIKNASFDVYAGEIFGFLGPNGSGKTTTIKMIIAMIITAAKAAVANGLPITNCWNKPVIS